jgi:hypothetical protein
MLDTAIRPRASRPATTPARSPRNEPVIHVVLRLLREQLGMDVVHVGHYSEGDRRFRVVEALHHGPAAALATTAELRDAMGGELLEAAITLPGGRAQGVLCCYSPAGADSERQLRLLRHGARLAARLLDNDEVLRELARQVPSH